MLLLTGCSIKSKYYGGGSSGSSSVGKKATKATMRPYTVAGVRYYPRKVSIGDSFTGIASWYGPNFHGKLTSNGETYNMYGMTAAHKTLPMNTIVRVTNLENRKSIVVRVNDRGPFVDDRIIDLTKTAATRLGSIKKGTAKVRVDVLGNNTSIPYNIGKSNHIRTKSTIVRNVPESTIIQQPKQTSIVTKVPTRTTAPAFNQQDIYVQIGSYGTKDKALSIQQQFDEQHSKASAFVKEDTARSMYKIIVGKFKTTQEARAFINTGEFPGAYLLRM